MSHAPLAYRPPASARFYAPPRSVDLPRALVGFAIAAVLIIAGSAAYVIAEWNVPSIIGRVIGMGIAALAVGLLALVPVRQGRVTLRPLAAAFGATLGVIAVATMWVVWLHRIYDRAGIGFSYFQIITRPSVTFHNIRAINDVGTVRSAGSTLRGVSLLICWLIEASAMVLAAVMIPINALVSDDPVCRSCGARCKRAGRLPRFADECQPHLLPAIHDRNYAAMVPLPAPPHKDAPELVLTLFSCPKCDQMHVLTVSRTAWVIHHNRLDVKITPLLNRLLLPAQDAADLKAACAAVESARTAPAEPAPEA